VLVTALLLLHLLLLWRPGVQQQQGEAPDVLLLPLPVLLAALLHMNAVVLALCLLMVQTPEEGRVAVSRPLPKPAELPVVAAEGRAGPCAPVLQWLRGGLLPAPQLQLPEWQVQLCVVVLLYPLPVMCSRRGYCPAGAAAGHHWWVM
jgi:hypothetical protein